MSDLVLSNALVLDPIAGRLLPDRHVVVEGGRIADVAERPPRSPKGRVIDAGPRGDARPVRRPRPRHCGDI